MFNPLCRAWKTNWCEIAEIAEAKHQGLKIIDEESGLMPFMMAADGARNSLDLNAVFILLTMQPDVMERYVMLDERSSSKRKCDVMDICEGPDEVKGENRRRP